MWNGFDSLTVQWSNDGTSIRWGDERMLVRNWAQQQLGSNSTISGSHCVYYYKPYTYSTCPRTFCSWQMVMINAERQTFYSLMPSLLHVVRGSYTKLTVSPSLVRYPELYLSNFILSNFHMACLHQSIFFYLCLVVANSIHLSKINEFIYYIIESIPIEDITVTSSNVMRRVNPGKIIEHGSFLSTFPIFQGWLSPEPHPS